MLIELRIQAVDAAAHRCGLVLDLGQHVAVAAQRDAPAKPPLDIGAGEPIPPAGTFQQSIGVVFGKAADQTGQCSGQRVGAAILPGRLRAGVGQFGGAIATDVDAPGEQDRQYIALELFDAERRTLRCRVSGRKGGGAEWDIGIPFQGRRSRWVAVIDSGCRRV